MVPVGAIDGHGRVCCGACKVGAGLCQRHYARGDRNGKRELYLASNGLADIVSFLDQSFQVKKYRRNWEKLFTFPTVLAMVV